MTADSTGGEVVLDEGWCTMWQTGLSLKGYRLHLSDAGDGRYLLTNRRLIWYRSFPGGIGTSSRYTSRIELGIRLFEDNIIELDLASLTVIAMKSWPYKKTMAARFNVGSGEGERAFVCLDAITREPSDRLTNRLFELIRENSQALDMSA